MKIHCRTDFSNKTLEINQISNKKMVKPWYIHAMEYYTAYLNVPGSSKSLQFVILKMLIKKKSPAFLLEIICWTSISAGL